MGLGELLHQTLELDHLKRKSILRTYNWFGIGLCCLMDIERLLLLNWNDLHSSWPYMKTEYQNFIILTIKSSWGHSIISFNLMASATLAKLKNSEWSLCTLNLKANQNSWLFFFYNKTSISKIHYASYQVEVWFLRLKYCNSKCSSLVNDLHSVWKKRWKSKIGDRLIRRRCTLCSSKWGAIPKHPLSIEDQVDIISYVVQLILNFRYKGNCC